jgi:hypothetical protein
MECVEKNVYLWKFPVICVKVVIIITTIILMACQRSWLISLHDKIFMSLIAVGKLVLRGPARRSLLV